MSLLNKLLIFLLVFPFLTKGQNCTISLHGRALDEVTGSPLSFATIYLENLQKGVSADAEGYFAFDNLCPDTTHIRISHVSCEPLRQYLIIEKDTILNVYLHHHEELMDEVLVHGRHSDQSIENSGTIDKDLISQRSNQDLSKVIEEIAGVSTLNTGSGISKPVIHGLYGNRITLLNNGVAQAGQQWGNDHAPEIDVFSADHISVIKGVGALAYPGSSLGGVVLIEPGSTSSDPHLHGNANYVFQTNGRGHTSNLELERGGLQNAIRFNGTLKKNGDHHTPNYFLRNTGKEEANASVLVEFGKTKTWQKKLFASTFNSTIGILRGAHIGNLTDLLLSFQKEIPFFTEDAFSYSIDAPRQKVHHHLVKLETESAWDGNKKITLTYAAQLDQREEFDVRRSGRSNTPSLSLRQFNQQASGLFERNFSKDLLLSAGLNLAFTDNTNQPETGILPLIPDFNRFDEEAFVILQKESGNILAEVGSRLSLNQLNVVAISRDLPRRIERFDHTFSNLNFAGGLAYSPSSPFKLALNGGYVERAPAVNELYSFGLHQGVSSLEVGNMSLSKEKSFKLTTSLDMNVNQKLFLQLLAYAQNIRNYIYLKPAPEPELTIRGAFPLFNYDQTNAVLKGLDALVSLEPVEPVRLVSKLSLLKGTDRSNAIPLVFMPSNNLLNELSVSFADGEKLKNSRLSCRVKSVFEQKNYVEGLDFVPPPETYHLFEMEFHTALNTARSTFHFSVRGENLFNVSYRDYLNRQRYFSDEAGRNLTFRVQWEF